MGKRLLFFNLVGNILATKNQIAQKIWVIHIIEIPRAKSSIQNCLSYGFQERVGVVVGAHKNT